MAVAAVALYACSTGVKSTDVTDTSSTDVSQPALDTGIPGSSGMTTTSNEQTQTVREEVAVLIATYPFSEPPPPAGSVEFMEWGVACLRHFGFDVEVVAEPGQDPFIYGSAGGQQARYIQVQDACLEGAMEAGHFTPLPQTEDEIRSLYRAYLKVQACLIGHDLPTVEPPSEDSFVAAYLNADPSDDWHPYAATPFGSSLSITPDSQGPPPADLEQQLHIQKTCPADWGTILRAGFGGP
jgi:hypothetical protein